MVSRETLTFPRHINIPATQARPKPVFTIAFDPSFSDSPEPSDKSHFRRIESNLMAEDQSHERKILVAVDQGEESVHALSWCLRNVVSRNSKDTLVLLYAKPPRTVYGGVDGTGYLFSSDILATMERYSDEVAESVMRMAARQCKELHDDVKVETMVEKGDPRDVICQVAERLSVDLLVLGSHGYGLIKRAFLGSVSNHCAQNVKCPVLIVKKPKPASADK